MFARYGVGGNTKFCQSNLNVDVVCWMVAIDELIYGNKIKLTRHGGANQKVLTQPRGIGQLVRGMAILLGQATTSCGVHGATYGSLVEPLYSEFLNFFLQKFIT